jgi:hypothetical protein
MQDDEPSSQDDLNAGGADVPDPSGPPRPMTAQDSALGALGSVIVVVACGVSLFLLMGTEHATCGATRSSQLKWEQREAEIDRAIREAETCGDVASQEASQEHDRADE